MIDLFTDVKTAYVEIRVASFSSSPQRSSHVGISETSRLACLGVALDTTKPPHKTEAMKGRLNQCGWFSYAGESEEHTGLAKPFVAYRFSISAKPEVATAGLPWLHLVHR